MKCPAWQRLLFHGSFKLTPGASRRVSPSCWLWQFPPHWMKGGEISSELTWFMLLYSCRTLVPGVREEVGMSVSVWGSAFCSTRVSVVYCVSALLMLKWVRAVFFVAWLMSEDVLNTGIALLQVAMTVKNQTSCAWTFILTLQFSCCILVWGGCNNLFLFL